MSEHFRILERQQVIADTCDGYRRQVELGGDPQEIVTGLAAVYSVQRPAIWKRLRAGGVLPPYRSGASRIKRHRRTAAECESDRTEQPRVDRDPCPRCGVRADVGCKHSRAPIGMVL